MWLPTPPCSHFVCFIISFQSHILLSYTTTMPDTVIALSIEYFVISIRPSRWWWFLNVNGQHTHVYLFLSLTHIPYWLADKQTHAQGERERKRERDSTNIHCILIIIVICYCLNGCMYVLNNNNVVFLKKSFKHTCPVHVRLVIVMWLTNIIFFSHIHIWILVRNKQIKTWLLFENCFEDKGWSWLGQVE